MENKEKCCRCNRKADISLSYTKLKYCKKHFKEVIERRVRKDLRQNGLIDTNKEYELVDQEDAQTEFLEELLNSIFSGRIKIRKINDPKNITDHMIIPTLLEEHTSELFEDFLENKRDQGSKGIRPLRTVSREEVSVLTGKKVNTIKTNKLLEDINKTQPNTFFSCKKVLEKT